MREFLIDQGMAPIRFVGSAGISEQPKVIAQRIRQALRFEESWASQLSSWTNALKSLREGIEASGILVIVNGVVGNNTHRKLDVEEFRGFVLVDEYAPLLFVNGSDGKAAQMFTLAHELAHVFFGSSAAFDLRKLEPANDPTERACNLVAAEFLVPEIQLRQTWPSVSESPNPFQDIARQFKVSELVAARRVLDLDLINRDYFLSFYQEYLDRIRDKAPTTDGGDFYATQNLRIGKRFARSVLQAAKEGTLLYSDAYRLTGLYGKTFEQYAERLKLG